MKAPSRAFLSMLFLLALIVPASAYEIPEADYPTLPLSAVSVETFVPAGWAIEILESGDLNNDRRDDLLLVLKEANPANMMTNDPASPGEREWDANPRILAVAFALKKGGYQLILQNNDILPRHENPCIDDPFGGAEIAGGTIKIGYHFWANAGSWYTASTWLTFRYRDKGFRLVAYSNYTAKRNTGETWDLKLDYVARKAEMTIGNFSSDEGEDGERTYTKRFPREPLRTLEEVSAGDGFYPVQANLSWWGIEETDY